MSVSYSTPDIGALYRTMFLCRQTEEMIQELWTDGLISGEMHLGTGEEAIIAGVSAHLRPEDALALDHRPTAAMVAAGIDARGLIAECMGLPSGICGGCGGHMHLFAPDRQISSSGIVGSSGPAAVGFAFAGQYIGKDMLSVGLFGDGAMNQGMLMESINLAVAWKLPVLFVCKDDNWAISTLSNEVTGGNLTDRARAMGLKSEEVDGLDVVAVWKVAGRLIDTIRRGGGPAFLRATCVHLDGHFLGDPLLSAASHPLSTGARTLAPAFRGATQSKGGSLRDRGRALSSLASLTMRSRASHSRDHDPLAAARLLLGSETAEEIEGDVAEKLEPILGDLRREYSEHWGSNS